MNPRMTFTTAQVLRVFLREPTALFTGYDVTAKTRIPSGTLYCILHRLERAGWLESKWENADPAKIGRPRKRFYQITKTGLDRAIKEMALLAEVVNIS